MVRPIIPFWIVFAILVSAPPAYPLDIATSISSTGTIVLSQMENFSFKSQGGSSLEFATLVAFSPLTVTTQVGIHGIGPSNLDGGWGYRSYEGAHLRLTVELPHLFSGLVAREAGAVAIGLGAGGGAFVSRYRETDLYFFYPSALLFLVIDFPTKIRQLRVRYLIPAEWYFRQDLSHSFSLGLSLGLVYHWTGPP